MMHNFILNASSEAPTIIGDFLVAISTQSPIGDLGAKMNNLIKIAIEKYPARKEWICLESSMFCLDSFKEKYNTNPVTDTVYESYLINVATQMQVDLNFAPFEKILSMYKIHFDIVRRSGDRINDVKKLVDIVDTVPVDCSFIRYRVYREMLTFLLATGGFASNIELTKYLTRQVSTEFFTVEQMDAYINQFAPFLRL